MFIGIYTMMTYAIFTFVFHQSFPFYMHIGNAFLHGGVFGLVFSVVFIIIPFKMATPITTIMVPMVYNLGYYYYGISMDISLVLIENLVAGIVLAIPIISMHHYLMRQKQKEGYHE